MPGFAPAARVARRFARVRVLLTVFALVALLGGPLAQNAEASKAWCRTDPVIMVDQYITDVFVSGPLSALLTVTGPTELVVTVPTGVDAWVMVADLGFGRGVNVTFQESDELTKTRHGVEIEVAAYVPSSDAAMPVRVEVAPRILGILRPASAEGLANEWVVLRTRV